MKILMVCLGNICRSPIAEGVLKHKLQLKNIKAEVDSAATGSWHSGERPDARAIFTAKKRGIDISGQRARQIQRDDFSTFDLIYVMDSEIFNHVTGLAKNENEKRKVDFLMNVLDAGGNRPVPDPYFGGDEGFDHVFDMIEEACEKICDIVKANQQISKHV